MQCMDIDAHSINKRRRIQQMKDYKKSLLVLLMLAMVMSGLFALSSDSINTAQAEQSKEYAVLQFGDRGDGVLQLKQRFVELGYMTEDNAGFSGSATNAADFYGPVTKSAVEQFQQVVGLPNSGIADNETQQRLFANDAPKAKVYKKLEYKALSRDPDAYVNEYYSFFRHNNPGS